MDDIYPVWAVVDENRRVIAYPYNDGTVQVGSQKWDRKKWNEYKAQVEELFDISEREDTA